MGKEIHKSSTLPGIRWRKTLAVIFLFIPLLFLCSLEVHGQFREKFLDLPSVKKRTASGTIKPKLTDEMVVLIAKEIQQATKSSDLREMFNTLMEKGYLINDPMAYTKGFSSVHVNDMPPRTMRADDRIFQSFRHASTSMWSIAQQRNLEARKRNKANNITRPKKGMKAPIKTTSKTPVKKEPVERPVEFQMMYADGKVFISCNNKLNLDRIKTELERDGGKNLLLGKNLTRDLEDYEQRWLKKLQLILESPQYLAKHPDKKPIKTLLERFSEKPGIIDLKKTDKPDPFNDNHNLFLVYGAKKHAELQFKDLILRLGDNGKEYTISGRKRPCAACHIELCELEAKHRDRVFFTSDFGKIWLKPFFEASKKVKNTRRLKDYIKEVFGETSTTEGHEGVMGELSDSEAEERPRKRARKD